MKSLGARRYGKLQRCPRCAKRSDVLTSFDPDDYKLHEDRGYDSDEYEEVYSCRILATVLLCSYLDCLTALCKH